MALYCIISYFSIAVFFSVLIWAALVASKKDDASKELDMAEISARYEFEDFQELPSF